MPVYVRNNNLTKSFDTSGITNQEKPDKHKHKYSKNNLVRNVQHPGIKDDKQMRKQKGHTLNTKTQHDLSKNFAGTKFIESSNPYLHASRKTDPASGEVMTIQSNDMSAARTTQRRNKVKSKSYNYTNDYVRTNH